MKNYTSKNAQDIILDPNDPEVIRLLKLTKEQQEKNLELKKIDEKTLNLIVNI
jgi:hypothetical protein